VHVPEQQSMSNAQGVACGGALRVLQPQVVRPAQMPVQQSPPHTQLTPTWAQAHVPFTQLPEQQSPFDRHAVPEPAHAHWP
jgi:hypothetical protein